jgi:hypothetical protein
LNGTLVKDFETAQKAAKTGAAASSAGKSPKKAAKAAKKPAAAAAAAAAAAKQKKVKVEKKAVKAEAGTDNGKKHKYKDEDGRLDRKKMGYYDKKDHWESAGAKAGGAVHTGTASLAASSMPKAFKKADTTDQQPEKFSAKREVHAIDAPPGPERRVPTQGIDIIPFAILYSKYHGICRHSPCA